MVSYYVTSTCQKDPSGTFFGKQTRRLKGKIYFSVCNLRSWNLFCSATHIHKSQYYDSYKHLLWWWASLWVYSVSISFLRDPSRTQAKNNIHRCRVLSMQPFIFVADWSRFIDTLFKSCSIFDLCTNRDSLSNFE